MTSYINFALLCFTSFITLMNPLGIMPVFMTMTQDFKPQARKATAMKAFWVAFFTLLGFAISGQLLFSFFNITVDSFRVVGGIIFFYVGMDMLNARVSSIKLSKNTVKEDVTDISITPLAIPMICGPGAITNAIVLMDDTKMDLVKIAILAGSIFLVVFITYLVLVSSGKIMKLLGHTGNRILMRLMGLIVMVIAVEFLLSGLKPILRDIFKIQ